MKASTDFDTVRFDYGPLQTAQMRITLTPTHLPNGTEQDIINTATFRPENGSFTLYGLHADLVQRMQQPRTYRLRAYLNDQVQLDEYIYPLRLPTGEDEVGRLEVRPLLHNRLQLVPLMEQELTLLHPGIDRPEFFFDFSYLQPGQPQRLHTSVRYRLTDSHRSVGISLQAYQHCSLMRLNLPLLHQEAQNRGGRLVRLRLFVGGGADRAHVTYHVDNKSTPGHYARFLNLYNAPEYLLLDSCKVSIQPRPSHFQTGLTLQQLPTEPDNTLSVKTPPLSPAAKLAAMALLHSPEIYIDGVHCVLKDGDLHYQSHDTTETVQLEATFSLASFAPYV